MKRITSSVGLLALGAASLQAQYAPGLSQMETSKPWSVSAAVRGFYDDNYTTSPNASARESVGYELAPEVGFNWIMDQTLVRASYGYSGKYFEDDSHWDHGHSFDLSLAHQFSERYSFKVTENFSVAQEPDVLSPGTGIPLRTEGDNVRNIAEASFNGAVTQTLGYEAAYKNSYFAYDDVVRSRQLDRMEHSMRLGPTWVVQESTILSLNAEYVMVRYSEENTVPFQFNNGDNDVYRGFAGVSHDFSSQLSGSARFGFSYIDSEAAGVDSEVIPYVDVRLEYSYAELSSVAAGLKMDRNQTDVANAGFQNSTVLYVQLNHQLASKLSANVYGGLTSSEYVGGTGVNDGNEDLVFTISGSLKYAISTHYAAEAGYSFTNFDSDIVGRSYDRNRIFVGASATF